MSIHPDMTAFRAVDACGGTYSTAEENSGYAQGHHDALSAAADAVRPVDALTAELFKVVFNLIDHHEGERSDELFRKLPNHVAWAVVLGRQAIAKATGEASA